MGSAHSVKPGLKSPAPVSSARQTRAKLPRRSELIAPKWNVRPDRKKVFIYILLFIPFATSLTLLNSTFKTGRRRLRSKQARPNDRDQQSHTQTDESKRMDQCDRPDSLALMRSPSASLMALMAFSLSTLAWSMTSWISFSSGSTVEVAAAGFSLSSDETSSGAL